MSDVEKIGSAGIPLNIVDANGRKIMGDAYDNTTTYAVGDYCISGDHAYKCTTKIETPEDFNTNHWQQITIEEILKEHDASIELVNSSLTHLPLIQRGCKKNVSLSANSQTEVNIPLTTPILTDYAVVCSIVIWSTANSFQYVVRDRAQSSFNLRVWNGTASTTSVEIDWIAIPV